MKVHNPWEHPVQGRQSRGVPVHRELHLRHRVLQPHLLAARPDHDHPLLQNISRGQAPPQQYAGQAVQVLVSWLPVVECSFVLDKNYEYISDATNYLYVSVSRRCASPRPSQACAASAWWRPAPTPSRWPCRAPPAAATRTSRTRRTPRPTSRRTSETPTTSAHCTCTHKQHIRYDHLPLQLVENSPCMLNGHAMEI